MEDDKTITSPEVADTDKPTEFQGVSRRSFMRKSAEIAALSLFGVLGLDAVTDRVLERIAEDRAIGKLSDVAAGALKEHRLDYFASAYDVGCSACTHCNRNYSCSDEAVGCTTFSPDGCDSTPNPYGCTTRDLTCGETFICDYVNCTENGLEGPFTCPFECGIHYHA